MKAGEELSVSLEGDLTIYRAAEIREVLASCVSSGAVIDLSRTGAVDSCAMQLFIAAKKDASARGTTIHLTGHTREFIKMLDLYGLIALFKDSVKVPPGLKSELSLTYSLSHDRGNHES